MNFSRRHFFKTTTITTFGLFQSKSIAQSLICKDAKADNETVKVPAGKILFFCDGAIQQNGQINSANFAFFCAQKQSPDEYLERIVITNKSGETLGVRYYSADEQSSNGFPPYAVFTKVAFARSPLLFVLFKVQIKGVPTIWRLTLERERIRPTLPQILPLANYSDSKIELFSLPLNLGGPNIQNFFATGDITSMRQSLRDLQFTAEFMNRNKIGAFSIKVTWRGKAKFNAELKPQILVTDPVGRLMAHKFIESHSSDSVFLLTNLTLAEAKAFGLPTPAHINDCSYLKVFVCSGDAVGYCNISLI